MRAPLVTCERDSLSCDHAGHCFHAAIPAAKRKLLDEIVDSLCLTQNLAAIVLGGSHARGTQRPDSDLNIGLVYRPSEAFAIGDIRAIAQSSTRTRLRV